MVTIEREFEKRDKKVHKMTRDGAVEKNLATGEETRVSSRGQDFDLRKERPAHSSTGSVRQAIAEGRSRRQPPYTPETPPDEARASGSVQDALRQPESGDSYSASAETSYQGSEATEQTAREAPVSDERSSDTQNTGRDTRNKAAYRHQAAESRQREDAGSGYNQPDTVKHPVPVTPEDLPEEQPSRHDAPDALDDPVDRGGQRKKTSLSERSGRLRFDDSHGELSEAKPSQRGTKYQRRFVEDSGAAKTETPASGGTTPSDGARPDKGSAPDTGKKAEVETPSADAGPGKKLKKAQYKAEHSAVKLESAKKRLPTKHSVKVETNFDAESGKPKRRLRFEEEVKTKAEHLKGSLPTRPVKAGAAAALGFAHKKISEAEQENVGVEAVHKGERLVEGGLHRAYRFNKLRPYRRVAKLEQKSAKHAVDLAWQKTLRENPRLQSSPLSRMAQKRKIKKQYAKAAREAKRTAERTKKAGTATAKATRAVGGFIKRHPMLVGAIALVLVILFFFSSLFTSCSGMAGSSFTSVILSSYTSEDDDILAVEDSYTRLEAELQARIDSIETDYPNYDAYRYNLAQIGHDPFELASYLTAMYFDYTPDEVQAELQRIFGQQYTLTVTSEVEVRYRTESRTGHYTDDDGNRHSYTYYVEVAYNYYILNVTLVNRSISSVAAANLDAEQLELYALYMETKGNKSYLFEGNIYVDWGSITGGYTVPGEALSDPDFAALIAEAEKYLGYPYVWGGSLPSTSFDCSGFVCWVLNQSGIASVGRTTATGLLNLCTVVSASEAQPGDLIFFQGTYNTTGASHVGIYVGNGMMLHCGSPIQYTSINSTYWKSHFLAFGRIN